MRYAKQAQHSHDSVMVKLRSSPCVALRRWGVAVLPVVPAHVCLETIACCCHCTVSTCPVEACGLCACCTNHAQQSASQAAQLWSPQVSAPSTCLGPCFEAALCGYVLPVNRFCLMYGEAS